MHGDIIFDDPRAVEPGCPVIRRGSLAAQFAALPRRESRDQPETRLTVYRRVAASIPQRHQSERNPVRYAARLL